MTADQQTSKTRTDAVVMLFRATTALNVAAFELIDETVSARDCHRAMIEATNLIAEAMGMIKRTFP